MICPTTEIEQKNPYRIEGGVVFYNDKPTSVKAFYTKKEIRENYHWGKQLMIDNLMELRDKIYKTFTDRYGRTVYIVTKKVFSPAEMCEIFNYYGLP